MPATPDQVEALVEQVRPLLSGKPRDLVAGALADLVSIFLASHFVLDDMDEISRDVTDKLRAVLLDEHVAGVRKLLLVNESILMTRTRGEAS